MHNSKLGNIFKGDKTVWFIFFFLCLTSIIEVYSATSQLTYSAGTNYWGPIARHAVHLAMGFTAMYITTYIPCRWFKSGTLWIWGITIAMLVYVAASGKATNGAQRWFPLPFGLSFQPSEIAKGVLILATAQILGATQTEKGASPQALGFIITICAIPVALIAIDNLSTAVLISAVILLMIFIGRVPARQIGKLLGVIAITVILGLSAVFLLGKTTPAEAATGGKQLTEQTADSKEKAANRGVLRRLDTWKARLERFGSEKNVTPAEVDLRGKGSQAAYAKIAIATSNIVGKGPGNSEERDYLAQAYSDFIYAIIIEELGIGGAAGVAALYIVLLFRAGAIARRCERSFPAFLVMGLALLFVVQALFNMYVAVGIIPVTGQPLPLISRGGTSTIINCVYFGMILSVSRSAKKKEATAGNTPGTQTAIAA